MDDGQIVQARQRAERAVKDMKDGPLKIAAFETILVRLLAETSTMVQSGPATGRRPTVVEERPNTLRGRVLAIKAEGFFEEQRGIGEVREALGSRGWHYPVTTLSGLMQSLVRQKELRRERKAMGSKEIWKYSNS
jgi:hypothetical protein